MAIFSKVIIPFDGSEPCKRAASKALDIAKEQGAEVIGIKVINIAGGLIVPTDNVWSAIETKAHAKAQVILDELISMGSDRGVKIETVILEGGPTAQVAKYAADNNADLIVMGLGGKGGLGEKLLGSHTNKMLRVAPCPVLVIH